MQCCQKDFCGHNFIPGVYSFLYIHGIFSRFTGWQPGIQEGAADWDEDWDKLEEEGEIIEEEWLYMFNQFSCSSLYFCSFWVIIFLPRQGVDFVVEPLNFAS